MSELLADVIPIERGMVPGREPIRHIGTRQETIIVQFRGLGRQISLPSDRRPSDEMLALAESSTSESQALIPPSESQAERFYPLMQLGAKLVRAVFRRYKRAITVTTSVDELRVRNAAKQALQK